MSARGLLITITKKLTQLRGNSTLKKTQNTFIRKFRAEMQRNRSELWNNTWQAVGKIQLKWSMLMTLNFLLWPHSIIHTKHVWLMFCPCEQSMITLQSLHHLQKCVLRELSPAAIVKSSRILKLFWVLFLWTTNMKQIWKLSP